ncbi:MAG: virulence-associated protein E, partial [Clostridia bacterium]|nr:virulence-associated protein E [Clostridia bacterium]
FMDSLADMGGKESVVQIQGSWIIEVAELASMRRSETEEVKRFLSAAKDDVRLPYARNVQTLYRQCVFYGTTNAGEFLHDSTGNRRFWPVGIEGIGQGELEGLDAEVDQLWAEAVVRWRAGEVLWLSDELLKEAAEQEQQYFSVQDDLPNRISEFLDAPLPENWDDMDAGERRYFFTSELPRAEVPTPKLRDTVTIQEIRAECFGRDVGEISKDSRTEIMRIADAINSLPTWRKLKTLLYPRAKGYNRATTYARIGSEIEMLYR